MMAAVARRPRGRQRPRGRDRLPPAADLDHPAARRGRRFLHDPRKRQCTLCSLTSCTSSATGSPRSRYSEPAGDLIPRRPTRARRSRPAAPPRSTSPDVPASRPSPAVLRPARLSARCSPGCIGADRHRRQGLRRRATAASPQRRRRRPRGARSSSPATTLDGEHARPRRLPRQGRRGRRLGLVVRAVPQPRRPMLVDGRAASSDGRREFVGINIRDSVPDQAPSLRAQLRRALPVVLRPGRRGAARLPRDARPQRDPEHRRARQQGRVAASILGELPSTADAGRPGRGRRRP